MFERDIIFFLAKVISEASGPMQVDPIWPFKEILFNQEMQTIRLALARFLSKPLKNPAISH